MRKKRQNVAKCTGNRLNTKNRPNPYVRRVTVYYTEF
jgi:hypothetical protein